MSRFGLCRILGNDLPPLHAPTQTLDNLSFLLEHEPELAECRKSFVLNRIVDPRARDRLASVLERAGHAVEVIPIDPDVYRSLAGREARGDYLTNNNPARNVAIDLAFAAGADIALPFDGQVYISEPAWGRLRADVDASPDALAYAVPMIRLHDNDEVLASPLLQRDEEGNPTEPQLALGRACPERFDPAFAYGRGPKIELLVRLGVAGPWDAWKLPQWVALRERPRVAAYGRVARAGLCHRLASGNIAASQRIADRQHARRAGFARLVATADAMFGVAAR